VSIYDAADRGLGLGTEAVRLFVDWLFRQGVERVEGRTSQGNKAMVAVFERLGFRREEENRSVRYWLSRA
jgi:RimJ/RimL family protein N-acetyltransferase